MSKGISPFIALVITIGITVALGLVVSQWGLTLFKGVGGVTEKETYEKLQCKDAAFDFDTSYGTNGVDYNFSASPDFLRAKIINTGRVNLYNFTFQLQVSGTLYTFNVTTASQIYQANPLKPQNQAILEASLTTDLSGILTEVRITNEACPTESLEIEL